MRHGKKFNQLSRKSAHRKAMLSNMASSLLKHRRIKTTLAKAKALRGYVEPLITRAKEDNTHNRRLVFSYLQDKEAIQELFGDVRAKIADRPGGYTRIIRAGLRTGDNAEMAYIELVDFNDTYTTDEKKKAGRTRRSRRGSKAKSGTESTSTTAKKAPATETDTPAEEITATVESATDEVEAGVIDDSKAEDTVTVDETTTTPGKAIEDKDEVMPESEAASEVLEAVEEEGEVEDIVDPEAEVKAAAEETHSESDEDAPTKAKAEKDKDNKDADEDQEEDKG